MTEPTLVELIEAYDKAEAACVQWITAGHPMAGVKRDSPGEIAFDARTALYQRLRDVPGHAVSWMGAVYVAERGELTVVRDIRQADEIDREGR